MSGPRKFVPRSGIRHLAAGQEVGAMAARDMVRVQYKGADDRCDSACRCTLAKCNFSPWESKRRNR
jgi:hypothetical protein